MHKPTEGDSARTLDFIPVTITVFQTGRWLKIRATMYLMSYINENGDKVYTLKAVTLILLAIFNVLSKNVTGFVFEKDSPEGSPTLSAHPARFSPDDKFSRYRIVLKKRFSLLPTQQPPPSY